MNRNRYKEDLEKGEDDQQNNNGCPQTPHDGLSTYQKRRMQRMARSMMMKRQDSTSASAAAASANSWTGFKDKAYRMACTVVLPQNKRCCPPVQPTSAMKNKSKSISVKSLPQMKRDDEWRARRKQYTRSISEPRSSMLLLPTPTTPGSQLSLFPGTDQKITTSEASSSTQPPFCKEDARPLHFPGFPVPTTPIPSISTKKVCFKPRTSLIMEESLEDMESCPSAAPSPPADIYPGLSESLPKSSYSSSLAYSPPHQPYSFISSTKEAQLLPPPPPPPSPVPMGGMRSLIKGLSLQLNTGTKTDEEIPPSPLNLHLSQSLMPYQPPPSRYLTTLETQQRAPLYPTLSLKDEDDLLKFPLSPIEAAIAAVAVQKSQDKGMLDPVDNQLEEEEYLSEEDDDKSVTYEDFYNCVPPPIFMLLITIVEVGFFIYHTKILVNNPKYGSIGKYGPAPLDSVLIYNPTRRHEIWRYLTYAFVHSGYMHIINNVVIQLVLGILLEIVHKWQRVLCIYFAGIIAGSLATSITEPFNYLAGASAGVYALIAAHLSTVILNFQDMEHPWIRVLVFVAFLLHDGGTAVYFSYFLGEKTNVGYSAHLGGCVAGLLVGIHVLKNIHWSDWEKRLWYLSIVLCVSLLAFAIAWNIFRSDLFP